MSRPSSVESGADQQPRSPSRTQGPLGNAWFGILGVGAVVLCCAAGPVLIAAIAAGGAGAWLASHGALLAGAALLGIAALVGAVAIGLRRSVTDVAPLGAQAWGPLASQPPYAADTFR